MKLDLKEATPLMDPAQGSWSESVRKENFRQADKFDYFKCSLEDAEKIFAELRKRKRIDDGGVKQLVKDFNVELIAIAGIARLLLRQAHSRELQQMGTGLLAACSSAGDPSAIMAVCRIGANKGQMSRPHFQKHVSQLADLATKANNPTAQVLWAGELDRRNRVEEAIKYYEKALEGSTTADDTNEDTTLDKVMRNTDDTSVALIDAYAALGSIYLERTYEVEKARDAFSRGAFHADDPEAYAKLAEFEQVEGDDPDKPRKTELWVEYMTKAAATGHPHAQLELAKFYSMTELEAEQRTTYGALTRWYNYAGNRVVSLKAKLTNFSRRIEDLIQLYCVRIAAATSIVGSRQIGPYSSKARTQAQRHLNRLAWALEWYDLCSLLPPNQVGSSLGTIRCLRLAGDDQAAFAYAKSLLQDDAGASARSLMSDKEMRALQEFFETGDEKYLDGSRIVEEKPAPMKVARTPRLRSLT